MSQNVTACSVSNKDALRPEVEMKCIDCRSNPNYSITFETANNLAMKTFRIVVIGKHKGYGSKLGTGFICNFESKLYLATACHVLDVYDEAKENNKEIKRLEDLKNNIKNEIKSIISKGNITIYMNRRIKLDKPELPEEFPKNYFAIDLKKFFENIDNALNEAIIQPTDNVDIALFLIKKKYL